MSGLVVIFFKDLSRGNCFFLTCTLVKSLLELLAWPNPLKLI
jgi:hypothetical protein